MNVGEPVRTVVVEPVEDPVPARDPAAPGRDRDRRPARAASPRAGTQPGPIEVPTPSPVHPPGEPGIGDPIGPQGPVPTPDPMPDLPREPDPAPPQMEAAGRAA